MQRDQDRPGSGQVVGRLLAQTAAGTALSVLALAASARLGRRGALQPLNATSHWLNGTEATATVGGAWRTTGVGLLTHTAATGFWAVLLEFWPRRGRRTPRQIVGKAAAMAGVAALVDYRATPKRFTPGWEFVLSPAAMAVAYFAMAAGFALAPDPCRFLAARGGREVRPSSGSGESCRAAEGSARTPRRGCPPSPARIL